METESCVAAAVVGLVVVGVWWLSRRCRRSVDLQLEVEVAREAVFNFLRDPNNLQIVHPRTTGIRTEEERTKGNITELRFVWMEEVPSRVESPVVMTCDPTTFHICMDITPPTGTCKVHVKWVFDDAATYTTTRTASDTASQHSNHTDKHSGATMNSDSTCASILTETEPSKEIGQINGTSSVNSQKDGVSPNAAAPRDQNSLHQHLECSSPAGLSEEFPQRLVVGGSVNGERERKRTLFRNTVTVTGPHAFVLIILMIVPKMQRALMENLKKHMEKRS
ncbi:hypothetical protein BaRGS_00036113 [Batillaria attramentaria]|uniref:Uncharacterized protein n=1 Tax=Batillaria attramentaria TaxID=370345 RepID=A0ABD0JCW9_9CAEN